MTAAFVALIVEESGRLTATLGVVRGRPGGTFNGRGSRDVQAS